jgi:hypothetical protein
VEVEGGARALEGGGSDSRWVLWALMLMLIAAAGGCACSCSLRVASLVAECAAWLQLCVSVRTCTA